MQRGTGWANATALEVLADSFSGSAQAKIEAAGGSAILREAEKA